MGKIKDKSLEDILNRSTAEKLVVVESLWENIREQIIDSPPSKDELVLVEERYEQYKKKPVSKKWDDIKKSYLKN